MGRNLAPPDRPHAQDLHPEQEPEIQNNSPKVSATCANTGISMACIDMSALPLAPVQGPASFGGHDRPYSLH
jgi:hypothetical protein